MGRNIGWDWKPKLVVLAKIKVAKMIKVANFEAMIIIATDFDHCC